MSSQIEWIAVILLAIGIVKMIVGFISPRHLLDFTKNPILTHLMNYKNFVTTIMIIIGAVLVYFTVNSGVSFAQWFVAGFSFYIIMMALFFNQKEMWDGWLKSFSKMSDGRFRIIALGWLIFSVVGLYLIFY